MAAKVVARGRAGTPLMAISLDDLFDRIAEQEQAKREKPIVPPDPFRKKRTEPGRARPGHAKEVRVARSSSLGGKHS